MIVLVHGVPETAALWDPVRRLVAGPSVALSLPGFGCPRPEGFPATKDAYVAWIVAQLEALGEPVHLVGHDWGALLTYRIATTRPDLLTAWTADVGNVVHPDYVWHDFARAMQASTGSMPAVDPALMAGALRTQGVAAEHAPAMASAMDGAMRGCIADLYRSAAPNVFHDWPMGPTEVPGLVLCPTADPFGDLALSAATAQRLGARHEVLEGLGHWWMLEAPDLAAALLSGGAAQA